MTKSSSPAARVTEDTLNEALAALIASTRSKKRPLPLTAIARKLEVAVAGLGSYGAVAERIGLSAKMLKQFSCVTELTRSVQKLFESRVLDSVDAAAHLAKLPAAEQKTIAAALASSEIDTSDVRAVVELRQRKGGSISDILRSVRESKTQQEYIAEFVIRGNRTHTAMLKAFQKHIPRDEILRLEIHGALGRLVLSRKGKDALARTAKELDTPVAHIVQTILSSSNRV